MYFMAVPILVVVLLAIVAIIWILSSMGIVEPPKGKGAQNRHTYETLASYVQQAIYHEDTAALFEEYKLEIKDDPSPIAEVFRKSSEKNLETLVVGTAAKSHANTMRRVAEMTSPAVAGKLFIGNLKAHHKLRYKNLSKDAEKELNKAERSFKQSTRGKGFY
jgi:hypothetical protein